MVLELCPTKDSAMFNKEMPSSAFEKYHKNKYHVYLSNS